MLEKNTITVASLLEQVQYIVAGWLFCLTYVILIWKKNAVASSYCFIETDFVQWSCRRGTNPDRAYKKCVQTFKVYVTPCVLISICVFFGPLLAAINDLGTVPLDDRSHFTMFWPKVSIPSKYVPIKRNTSFSFGFLCMWCITSTLCNRSKEDISIICLYSF